MSEAGTAIAGIAGLGIFVVRVLYLVVPRTIAVSFGLPAIPHEDATPWLRLKGIRDLATGIVAGILILAAAPELLGWAVIAFAIIPLGDAITILRAKGARWAALGVHGATAVVMLLGGVLLLSV